MFEYLEKFVVGQQRAKKVLSVAMYNHYKRLKTSLSSPKQEQEQEGGNGGYLENVKVQLPIGTRELISLKYSLCMNVS